MSPRARRALVRAIANALRGTALLAVAMPVVAAGADGEAHPTRTIATSQPVFLIERRDLIGNGSLDLQRAQPGVAPPVFVLEREDIDRSGLTSLGDVLQQLTQSGAALNTKFNSGGTGETQVDLRDLGASRTLVLVDGRRWVSNLDGIVDIDGIPLAVVERVEVLTGAASALYGSDAIAGVVNIVTRERFDGAAATAHLGESSEGDGRTEAYDFTLGTSSDRASVLMNASYTKQEPVLAGDREISSVPLFGFPGNDVATGASSTTPFGRFGFGPTGGRLPNGAPGTLTLIPGRPGTSPGDFDRFDPARDGYNFAPSEYLLTPQERTAVYVHGRYQLTGDIRFRTSLLYDERRSAQRLAPYPNVFGTAGSGIARFAIPANALYNPFGVDVTRAQFRDDATPRTFTQDVDTVRFAGALEGRFTISDRTLLWDIGYAYADREQRGVNEGQFDFNRLARGLGPSFRDANGVATCGTPLAPIAGCVPLNIFGGPEGFTREMADYALFTEQDDLYRKTYDYTANIAGDLFDLPAGALAFSAGYEYRRELGFDQPDAFVAAGTANSFPRQPARGGYSLDEWYAELVVPLLADVPAAQGLALTLAARRSDYSNFGHTTNPQFGFRWRIAPEWTVRGEFAQGFRAPSIAELFRGPSDSFPSYFDPCSASLRPSGEVLARCRNGFGGVGPVPVGYDQTDPGPRFTVGGNADLEPESARSRTLDLAYDPRWIDGLAVHLGWYDIEVEQTIAYTSAQGVLDDCYLVGDVSACAQMSRQPSGEILALFHGAQNRSAGVATEGYDLGLDYELASASGRYTFGWDTNYVSYIGDSRRAPQGACPVPLVERAGAKICPVQASTGNLVGAYRDRGNAYHRIKSNFVASWARGDWEASITARYRSGLDEDCALPVAFGRAELCSDPDAADPQFSGAPTNHLDDTWYFDLQLRWDAPWDADITTGVRNAFDEGPPVSFSTFGNNFDPSYDVPGRFWYVRYAQRF